MSANLDGFKDNSKVFISDISSQKVLDSTTIIDGKFVLSGFLDNQPSMVSLMILSDDREEINYTSIFMGNEKISISGDKSTFSNGIKVLGSQYHGLKVDFDKQVNPLYDERDNKLQQMFTLRMKENGMTVYNLHIGQKRE